MLVRKVLTAVPWMKLKLRKYFTFLSSSFRILSVIPLRRLTSCWAKPRLFTSSIFRNDSVVEPASAVVSATIVFCMVLIRLLSTELIIPSSEQERWSNRPVHVEGIDHYEDNADERSEKHIDSGGYEALHVATNFLQLAQGFTAALVLEYLVGQIQRMPDPIRVHPRAQPLHDHVHEIVLEILSDSRHKRHPHRRQQ